MTMFSWLQAPVAAACSCMALAGLATAQGKPDDATKAMLLRPAVSQVRPDTGPLMAAARAGNRLVAAGAHGVIVLSDDGGKSFRQARVPVRLQLNGLHFVDERAGFAVGHGGVILATTDGGESWSVVRTDFETDQPLFSVYFSTPKDGWAVGLWSLMLRTSDGGKTWTQVSLPVPSGQKKADLNLFKIFGSGETLYVACERGLVLRSSNGGQSWDYSSTGYPGSLWSGVAWQGGAVLVGGLRGSLFRSSDEGRSWRPIATSRNASITAMASTGSTVRVVGLDGLVLESEDQGLNFREVVREGRDAFTGIVARAESGWFKVSKSGAR